MKKQIKNSTSGITLIALIVTIVVLLILAGVSLATLTGENGVVTRARNSSDATKVGLIKEQLALYQTENQILEETDEDKKSINDFIDELESKEYITSEEKEIILEEHELTIGEQETIIFPFGKTLVEAFKDGELTVGDYVNYAPSDLSATVEVGERDTGVDEIQTYSVDPETTWRVLGLNESETNLLLISGSPIKRDGDNPYLRLSGPESYYFGIDTLNKISNIYHNSKLASETRSINIEDINNVLGIVQEGNKFYQVSGEEKKVVASISDYTYTYKAGDYAPENYLKEKYPDDEEIQKLDTKEIGDIVEENQYSYYKDSIVDKNTIIYDLLIHDTSVRKSYWLATKGMQVLTSYDELTYGLGAVCERYIMSCYAWTSAEGYDAMLQYGVRPVVSLKSNITIEQVVKTAGNEIPWEINLYSGHVRDCDLDKGQL